MSNQLDRRLEDLDKAMRLLRTTMRAPVIRACGGFTKHHTQVGKAMGTLVTTLEDARPLFNTDAKAPAARKQK